jgi:hypothetical protein
MTPGSLRLSLKRLRSKLRRVFSTHIPPPAIGGVPYLSSQKKQAEETLRGKDAEARSKG